MIFVFPHCRAGIQPCTYKNELTHYCPASGEVIYTLCQVRYEIANKDHTTESGW